MNRRSLILTTTSVTSFSIAGCLGIGDGQESQTPQDNTSRSEIDVNVDFEVSDGDLVASHLGGDTLHPDETVLITVSGEPVFETVLEDTVYAGGEIVRVDGLDEEHHQTKTTALYVERNGDMTELLVEEVRFSDEPTPYPNVSFDFDYSASTEQITITSSGGVTTDNTGFISVTGVQELTNDDWGDGFDPDGAEGFNRAVVTDSTSVSIQNVPIQSEADEVAVIWENHDETKSHTLGSYIIP